MTVKFLILGFLEDWDVPLPEKILSLKPREIQEVILDNGNHIKFKVTAALTTAESDEADTDDSLRGRLQNNVIKQPLFHTVFRIWSDP